MTLLDDSLWSTQLVLAPVFRILERRTCETLTIKGKCLTEVNITSGVAKVAYNDLLHEIWLKCLYKSMLLKVYVFMFEHMYQHYC